MYYNMFYNYNVIYLCIGYITLKAQCIQPEDGLKKRAETYFVFSAMSKFGSEKENLKLIGSN